MIINCPHSNLQIVFWSGCYPPVSRIFRFTGHLQNIYRLRKVAQQEFSKVISRIPEQPFLHISVSMTLAWQQDELETFICFDEENYQLYQSGLLPGE